MVLYSVPIIVGESWGMCSHLAVSWYWLQRQHFRTRHNMCAWQVQVVGSYARAWQAIRSVVTCVFARTNREPFLYVLMHRAFCVALGFGLMCLATTAFGAKYTAHRRNILASFTGTSQGFCKLQRHECELSLNATGHAREHRVFVGS